VTQDIVFNHLVDILLNKSFALLLILPGSDGGRDEFFLRGRKVEMLVLEICPLSWIEVSLGRGRVIHFLELPHLFKVNAREIRPLLGVLNPLHAGWANDVSVVQVVVAFFSGSSSLWMDALHIVIFVHDVVLDRFSVKPSALSSFNICDVHCVSYELARLIIWIDNDLVLNSLPRLNKASVSVLDQRTINVKIIHNKN